MAKGYELEKTVEINIIAAGTSLTGDIVTAGDCRVDGEVKGNIKATSKIIVGKTGRVEGKISCQAIDIEGKVSADINADGLLSLKATAFLEGNISVGKISIEPGANFIGSCVMQSGKRESLPEKTATN